MKTTVAVMGALILACSSLLGCAENPTNPDANVKPQEPGAGPRLILTEHLIETEPPCFVNIMFQVTEENGGGVDTLVTDDFTVLEDNEKVSPTESAMHIRKKDAIPYTLYTVLMLDNSRSVEANLAEIKEAALDFVGMITTQQKIAVYMFSEEPILLQDFTEDTGALTDAINSIEPGYATTDLYGSLLEGLSRWEDRYSTSEVSQGFLVVFTDGSDTQGSHSKYEVINARGAKKLYAIGLGDEIEPEVLEEIGNAGFFPIADVSELREKFRDVQAEMSSYANSFYWLNYMSPKRGDKQHALRLSIPANGNTGYGSYIEGNFYSTGFYSVYPGIYVNVSDDHPEGIDEVTLLEDEVVALNAITALGGYPPQYVWESSNSGAVAVEPSDTDYWVAYATARGDSGASATITVRDVANNMSKSMLAVIDGINLVFDFETGPEGWTVSGDSGLWGLGEPASWPDSAFSGGMCWGTNFAGEHKQASEATLTSPAFRVPEVGLTRCTVWLAYDFSYYENGAARVFAPSVGWRQLRWIGSYRKSDWEQELFDLSPYGGEEVRVAFWYEVFLSGSSNPGWYVDLVEVKSVPAADRSVPMSRNDYWELRRRITSNALEP